MATVGTAPVMGAEASRRAAGFAVMVLCLLLVARVAAVVSSGQSGQVPFTVVLLIIPLLYTIPGTRRLVDRYR